MQTFFVVEKNHFSQYENRSKSTTAPYLVKNSEALLSIVQQEKKPTAKWIIKLRNRKEEKTREDDHQFDDDAFPFTPSGANDSVTQLSPLA